MLCIAAFIIFAICGIFSAKYRSLTAKAWYCVKRRITFKPCDINFGDEVKNKLLGKMILKRPRLARFLDKYLNWFAFAFVALSIWSLWVVAVSSLNLWVYDTCDPGNAESCSLSGEACGVSGNQMSLNEAIQHNKIPEWLAQPFIQFGQTVSRIPDRLKDWQPKEYVSSDNTYYLPFDEKKPTALEVIDPGCQYCKKLFGNIKRAGFEQKYNLTYIAYPIPDKTKPNGYKFQNAYLMASYLESVKQVPLTSSTSTVSADWQLLEELFTGHDEKDVEWQTNFNLMYDAPMAELKLQQILFKLGYTSEQSGKIAQLAHSQSIQDQIAKNRDVVENSIRTIKIPTIMFNGRRYDRVIDESMLK